MVQTLTRRSLVRGMAAGTVANTFGSHVLARQATPAPAGKDSSDFDVIVVGAGAGGLGAGQKLAALGLRGVVLEARDRIGGRCYCDNTFPAPFDFGGQFFQQVVPNAFGGTNNPLYDLYIAQGGQDQPVVLVPDFYENGVRLPDAEQAPYHDMSTAIGAELAVAGIAAQLGAPDLSVTDLTADLAGQPWYTLTTAFLELALDAPASRLSVLDVWNDLQFAINLDGSPSDKVNPTGMGNFIAQFAQGLDIRLSTRLTEIDMTGDDRVKVVTDQGPLLARAVIVTAPVTVLAAGDIAFRPALPSEYRQAFDDLPFGVVDKIGIAFTTDVFGDRRGKLNGHPTSGYRKHRSGSGEDGGRADDEPDRCRGSGARARSRGRDGGGRLCARFRHRHFRRGSRRPDRADHYPRMGEIVDDGIVLGGQSGQGRRPCHTREPLENRLYFAGEAISTNAHSSLHGAYLTGQRAATSIFEHLGAPQ